MEVSQVQVNLDNKVKEEIEFHAKEEYPLEACGVLINFNGKQKYRRIKNISEYAKYNFILDPKEYAQILDEQHQILAIVHSHPNQIAKASDADRASCNKGDVPWIVVGYPNVSYDTIYPDDYKIPLVGRKFAHGITDCYSIIYDYYHEELGIEIPDFHRDENWWNKGQDIYVEGFPKAGFVQVDELKPHDVILIQLESNKTNHGAIYLGDTKILHHPMGRLSHITVYGGYWRKNTRYFLRHEQLIDS